MQGPLLIGKTKFQLPINHEVIFGYLSTFMKKMVFHSMQSCAIVVDYNQHDVTLFIR